MGASTPIRALFHQYHHQFHLLLLSDDEVDSECLDRRPVHQPRPEVHRPLHHHHHWAHRQSNIPPNIVPPTKRMQSRHHVRRYLGETTSPCHHHRWGSLTTMLLTPTRTSQIPIPTSTMGKRHHRACCGMRMIMTTLYPSHHQQSLPCYHRRSRQGPVKLLTQHSTCTPTSTI